MAGTGGIRKVPSLPPPMPKDPPAYPDLHGKRKELTRLQLLERETGFLEEELKYLEGLHPASGPCKEVADFVTTNSDPFVPVTTKDHKSSGFWKWLCDAKPKSILPVVSSGSSCLKCCSSGRTPHLASGQCYNNCNRCGSKSCISCLKPKCTCKMPSCSSDSCTCECNPFSNCLLKDCISCFRKCSRIDPFSCCKRYSCYHCCTCH